MSQPTTPGGGQWGELKHPRANNSQALAMLGKIVRYVLLIGLAILFLFPFYIIVRNSLMTQPEITAFDAWQWWPESPQWSNYRDVFEDDAISMATGLRVSALLAIINLVMQTLFASMAGYALARIPFRGRDVVFFLILLTLMIPGAVTFVPTYVVVSELGGINTLWVIVVPGLPPVAFGPYRFLPHPNYVAVVVEGIALPLVHAAWITAVVFTVLNAALLTVRIGVENAALRSLPAEAA